MGVSFANWGASAASARDRSSSSPMARAASSALRSQGSVRWGASAASAGTGASSSPIARAAARASAGVTQLRQARGQRRQRRGPHGRR